MPNEIVPVTVKTKDEFQAAVRLKRIISEARKSLI